VLLAALAVAKQSLPPYSHRNSPRKFTQHQLFACLVLKIFLKTDYRGVVAHLLDCPSLVETLGLARVPHYTTLQKAARRLLSSVPAKRLLDATVREQLGRRRRVARAAIDSTGLESSAASAYFVNRRRYVGGPWKTVTYHRYPKLGLVCDVETHFILAYHTARGPKLDISEFQPLLVEALTRVQLTRIAADAGYDSEANHRFAREHCRIRSMIPPTRGRPTEKPARGHYRRLMQTRFDLAAYRDRVQVETVISMLKRRLEAFVRGRSAWSQRRELRLKVLTHNVMILLQIEVFYRAVLTPFSMAWSFDDQCERVPAILTHLRGSI
jgi:Transposase DDE domain